MLWVLIRSASLRASNEYPQHMFLSRNKKSINTLYFLVVKKSALFGVMFYKAMKLDNSTHDDNSSEKK